MRSIFMIYYFCVILLSIVSNGVGEHPLVKRIQNMAKEHEKINDIFEPSKRGYLGLNLMFGGIIYKGILFPSRMEVAMKFTDAIHRDGEKEYRMFTYLDAINQTTAEDYGVPTIYYYGSWENYTIMAMTLLDPEFYNNDRAPNFNEMDLLILSREFVRITKYMHTCGVFHEYFNIWQIRFRKHQGFIHDLTMADTPNVTTLFEHDPNLPIDGRRERLSAARRDWKKFLTSIYTHIAFSTKRWSWLGFSDRNSEDANRMYNFTTFASSLIVDSQTNEAHNFSGLRKVVFEFAKYAFSEDSSFTTPFYDQMYEVIVEELRKCAQQRKKPAIPSWLTKREDKENAIEAIDKIPSISVIRHPIDLEEIEYDDVNYQFFHRQNREQPSTSAASERRAPEKKSRSLFSRFVN